jgi:hypothetical protein
MKGLPNNRWSPTSLKLIRLTWAFSLEKKLNSPSAQSHGRLSESEVPHLRSTTAAAAVAVGGGVAIGFLFYPPRCTNFTVKSFSNRLSSDSTAAALLDSFFAANLVKFLFESETSECLEREIDK